MKIAERLKKLRTEAKLTMREVATRIRVPTSTYRDWEYGKAIQGEPYEKLAVLFGVSIEKLMTGRKPDESAAVEALLDAMKSVEVALRIVRAL